MKKAARGRHSRAVPTAVLIPTVPTALTHANNIPGQAAAGAAPAGGTTAAGPALGRGSRKA